MREAEEITRLLRQINQGLRRQMEGYLGDSGLTLPQMFVLRTLAGHPHLTLTALSREIGLANSTVSGIIDRLVRDGLVSRATDPSDRRISRLNLTAKAKTHKQVYVNAYKAAGEEVLNRLTAQELGELRAALANLARVLPPSPPHPEEHL